MFAPIFTQLALVDINYINWVYIEFDVSCIGETKAARETVDTQTKFSKRLNFIP